MIVSTLATLLLSWPGANTSVDQLPIDRPCKFEDSNFCVWDARHMGNGQGSSYVVTKRGKTIYVSHRLAHRMLND
jgi:hypothetical protein